TDYDCWHPGQDAVTADMILGVLLANAERAKALVRHVVPALSEHAGPCRQGCQRALDGALITASDHRDPAGPPPPGAGTGRGVRARGQGGAGGGGGLGGDTRSAPPAA